MTGRPVTVPRPGADAARRNRPIPILLDCDPGHDDALAILLALARPELRVLGITTVAGNADLERTTRNALRVLALAGRADVPVAAGAAAPLSRPLEVSRNVHGESGLDGAELPEPLAEPRSEGALAFQREVLAAAPEPVTLVATGPLTNVAALLRAEPRVVERIAAICLMGGAIGEGNTTASAEFNIWVDPEAAAIVFESGLPLAMMGLDVTHQAMVGPLDRARFRALGTPAGAIVADLLGFFDRFHRERYGWDGSPIHDAVAIGHVAIPGLVRTVPARVDIETASELTRGRTVVDTRGRTGRPDNAEVGVAIDRDRFVDLLVAAVAAVGSAPAD